MVNKMKRIHILQHEPYETSGCIEDWIKDKNYIYSVTEFYEGKKCPDVSDFDWLVIMGGSMSVHDTDAFPWLVEEKKLIQQAVNSQKIIIGVCLGSQLLAEVLGSRVYRNNVKEIGWYPVTRKNPENKSSPVNKFKQSETVFHWHGDTFDIPEGASHEFTSDACKNQCFIFGERIVGLQFHIEVTDKLLEGMIRNGAGEIIHGQYIQNNEQLRSGSIYIKRNNELMYSVLDELDKL